jgi:tRNA threonylcarbamoyladenosine biosynthesis protein TsaB
VTVLAVDTTAGDASIAVLRDGEIALECHLASHDGLSALLLPSLEFLLRSLGLAPAQVDLYAAAVGPGLFTGIRVGLATLKGMNFAAGRPMVGVGTLEALAFPFAGARRTVVPLVDARRGQLYVAAYDFAAGGMTERLAPGLLTVEEALRRLAAHDDALFVNGGDAELGDRLRIEFPAARLACRPPFLAAAVGRLALDRLQRGGADGDPAELRPLYIRKPDAETPDERGARGAD